MDNIVNEQQIARLTVSARVEFVPAILCFVRDISTKLGLPVKDIERLELVVEEACINVIKHAFDPNEQGYFDVIILRKPGQIAVAVEDRGLPFDFKKFEAEGEAGLGMILMKAFADEVRFLNLGRGGKRVELIKNLPYKDIAAYVSEEEKRSMTPTILDLPLTMRLMKKDDLGGLARCVYRSYGYTYASDYIYFPDRVKELLEVGLLVSCVAVTSKDEVIGHLAMNLRQHNALVGETGQAVVDPRYRGHGLFEKMKGFMINHAREIGMYGVYSEAVTVHPYTQKGNIALGAYETGLLLGFTPASMFFKDIQEKSKNRRQAAMLFYSKVNQEPTRDVYPPLHHQTMIRCIYHRNNLGRNIRALADLQRKIELAQVSLVDVDVHTEPNRAFLRIHEYGPDLIDLIKFRLRELCLRRIDCIYIDLPLSSLATAQYCAQLEMLGFFFAGIIPEMFEGDVLRLQYLNNVDIDPRDISVASDFGKELLDYVLKSKQDTSTLPTQ